jgi:hypothetical protein
LQRRALLGGILGGLGALTLGCGAKPSPTPEPPSVAAVPDRVPPSLAALLTGPGLQWLVRIKPAQLAATTWLEQPIARVLREDRLSLLTRATGIDLRRSPELLLAAYRQDVVAYLVRHRSDQTLVERRFRARLTSAVQRAELGHQLVGVWGNIGTEFHGFASIGRDVAGYQYGGDRKRGPVRIALLYAQSKLEQIPTALSETSIEAMHRAFGDAPAMVLLPGPFEGDMAGGVRGLLAAATAFGAALTPTASQTLRLQVLLAGEFSTPGTSSDERPSDYLEAAWADLATADLGHLLHLHEPRSAVSVSTNPLGLSLTVELDAAKLFDGLAAATIDDARAFMQKP